MTQIPSTSRTIAEQSDGPTFLATLLVSALVLLLGGLGVAQAQISAGENGLACGTATLERTQPVSPQQVADIEGLMAQLSAAYGDSIEKAQQMLQDDSDLVSTVCNGLLGNAHVVRDFKGGFLLVDEDEIALGDWRPELLNAEVTRDGFALACNFADVGMAGDKVLYVLHSMGLFNGDERLTYLADFGSNWMWVAIDFDGNRIGSSRIDPFGEQGNNPPTGSTVSRDDCAARSATDGAGPIFAACSDTQANPGITLESCGTCCRDLARACLPYAMDPADVYAFFNIPDNITDCYQGCGKIGSAAQLTLNSP